MEYKEPQYADHLERKLGEHLKEAFVEFVHESQDKELCKSLDFYLPNHNVFIEVKQYHSDRTKDQLLRDDNIIILQGKASVDTFCSMLKWRSIK